MEGTIFIFWNWTVAVYLFVAGVSAGAFAISALAYFLGEEKYQDITRIGAYIAPFPLMFGLLFLIYDLERPHLFWKLMVTLQVHSIMSLGAWLLVIFSLLSFVYFYLWLPDRFDVVELLRRTPPSWDKWAIVRLLKTNPLLEKLHRKNLNGLTGMDCHGRHSGLSFCGHLYGCSSGCAGRPTLLEQSDAADALSGVRLEDGDGLDLSRRLCRQRFRRDEPGADRDE